MDVRPWSLEGALVLRPEPRRDDRGFFVRTLDADALANAGLDHAHFVQESQSRSQHRVLRGLHGRRALSEGKLVRCSRGAIFEAVLDLRPWSSTFLHRDVVVLDDVDHLQLWVPPGLVHGFQVLSDQADVCYRMDARYEPGLDLALAWDDPEVGIAWPLVDPILSERDRSAPRLAELRDHLPGWFGTTRPNPGG